MVHKLAPVVHLALDHVAGGCRAGSLLGVSFHMQQNAPLGRLLSCCCRWPARQSGPPEHRGRHGIIVDVTGALLGSSVMTQDFGSSFVRQVSEPVSGSSLSSDGGGIVACACTGHFVAGTAASAHVSRRSPP